MREVGYYFVKCTIDDNWQIAYYEGVGSYPWAIPGSDEWSKDSDFSIIGDKIIMPE